MKSITYDELEEVIDDMPMVQVIATGEYVHCVTHDASGVICEDDNGVVDYEHSELAKIDEDWNY